MVIKHADSLHEGIAYCGAYEAETTLLQSLAHTFARCGGKTLGYRFAINKIPDVGIESSEFLLNSKEGFSIFNHCIYFQSIADDAFVFE